MDLDPQKHPTAFAEAQHNIDRAIEISPGTVAIRQLQADLKRKIAAAGAGVKKTADGKTVAVASRAPALVIERPPGTGRVPTTGTPAGTGGS